MAWRFIIFLLFFIVLSVRLAEAQAENGPAADIRNGSPVPESDVARSEQELAGRAVELRKALEAEDRQRQTNDSFKNQKPEIPQPSTQFDAQDIRKAG